MIRYSKDMPQEPKENVRGGVGKYTYTQMFTREEVDKTTLFGKNVLPAGVSIGEHPHGTEGEAYVILKGNGIMIEDGKEYEVGPGDAEYCTGGHTHGIRNPGPGDLEFLAIIMK